MPKPLRLILLGVVAALILAPAAEAKPSHGKRGHHHGKWFKPVDVQLLGLNDFHGQLEPVDPASSTGVIVPAPGQAGVPAGGGEITKMPTDDSGESTAGNLIADAQLAASPDTVAAFMNPGGIRADIDAGPVTFGESFAMQPFGNNLVAMDLTGAQLRLLLKQQWCSQTTSQRILQVAGVSYTWDRSVATSILNTDCATAADPVSALTIAGAPIVDATTYRITVNSLLADGGDRFFVLREGTNRVGSLVDTDALEQYFASGPKSPPALTRIGVVD